jgi:hypothetical protein
MACLKMYVTRPVVDLVVRTITSCVNTLLVFQSLHRTICVVDLVVLVKMVIIAVSIRNVPHFSQSV